ncbi:hypothetical protein D917_06850 [Trichinella nativa]|uniref:Uncharacterized protein n=1 Tax=Trichinella nativa TaxID=6335 RepID=A0A1Y3EQY2_9BILA|nr:hypothetical protein D917_06850 [Trichinella nativa]
MQYFLKISIGSMKAQLTVPSTFYYVNLNVTKLWLLIIFFNPSQSSNLMPKNFCLVSSLLEPVV